MRKNDLWLCMLLTAASVLPVGIRAGLGQRPAVPQTGERLWEDGRIGVAVKKVEMKEALSCDIRDQGPGPTPFVLLRHAKAGYSLVCIHLVIAKVKAGHVTGVSLGTTLRDAAGREYQLVTYGMMGLEFLDPHDLASPSKLTESSVILLLFEVLTSAKPETLAFVYSFSNSWPAKSKEVALISVRLPAAR